MGDTKEIRDYKLFRGRLIDIKILCQEEFKDLLSGRNNGEYEEIFAKLDDADGIIKKLKDGIEARRALIKAFNEHLNKLEEQESSRN